MYLAWPAVAWRRPIAALLDHKLPVSPALRMESAAPQHGLAQSSSSDYTHMAVDQCRDARTSRCLEQSRVADGPSAPTLMRPVSKSLIS